MRDYDSGYMDGKAVMYERIAELEGELKEMEKEAYRTGMERAAEIVEIHSRAGAEIVEIHSRAGAEAIRKEIEK